jgi:hypothetical protein
VPPHNEPAAVVGVYDRPRVSRRRLLLIIAGIAAIVVSAALAYFVI